MNKIKTLMIALLVITAFVIDCSAQPKLIKVNGIEYTCPASFDVVIGETLIIEAIATLPNVFVSWTGDLTGSKNPDTLIITSPRTITINYSTIQDYVVSIINPVFTDKSTLRFDVAIKTLAGSLSLTSYQIVIGFAQAIRGAGTLVFTYIAGSSQFTSIPPSVGIGVQQGDGIRELSFASMPGDETITTTDKRFGSFELKNSTNYASFNPLLAFDFNGAVRTIITGPNITDITDPLKFNPGALVKARISFN